MHPPIISIIGSADEDRTDYDPHLRDVSEAHRVAEELGAELARQGCRIMVFNSAYIDRDVVRGYANQQGAPEKGILICYPHDTDFAKFAERDTHALLFDYNPMREDWEATFYRSLKEADGYVLIGGGMSTYISGLFALADKKPIFAFSRFGGRAKLIYEKLSASDDRPTDGEIRLMGYDAWGADMPRRCVAALLAQIERHEDEREGELLARIQRKEQALEAEAAARQAKETAEMQARQAREMRFAAIISAGLFLLVLAILCVGIGIVTLPPWVLMVLLFFSGTLAGASGASIKWLWQGEEATRGIDGRTLVLGLVAGGISALLYIIPQIIANQDLLRAGVPDADLLQGLRIMLLTAVMVALLAGFTFDKIYQRIDQMDAQKPDYIVPKKP